MGWGALLAEVAAAAVGAIVDAVRGRGAPRPEPTNPRAAVEEAERAARERARRYGSSGGLGGDG